MLSPPLASPSSPLYPPASGMSLSPCLLCLSFLGMRVVCSQDCPSRANALGGHFLQGNGCACIGCPPPCISWLIYCEQELTPSRNLRLQRGRGYSDFFPGDEKAPHLPPWSGHYPSSFITHTVLHSEPKLPCPDCVKHSGWTGQGGRIQRWGLFPPGT